MDERHAAAAVTSSWHADRGDGNQALADEFTENFNYPDLQWDRIATPERIQRWIDRLSAPTEQARATA
jgi:hypothetical protein